MIVSLKKPEVDFDLSCPSLCSEMKQKLHKESNHDSTRFQEGYSQQTGTGGINRKDKPDEIRLIRNLREKRRIWNCT